MTAVTGAPVSDRRQNRLHVLLIVRRYGAVGGMERYVWEVARELAALGHRVAVLCEEAPGQDDSSGVEVFRLGSCLRRPRWIAYLRFSGKVRRWVDCHSSEPWLIHSHERTGIHHVTTFHGPPFAWIRERPPWRRTSLRIAAYLWMERRELCGANVRAVVPNSRVIADQLRRFYPEAAARIVDPVVPGVAPLPERPFRSVPEDGGIVGFVGYEWKRKGLEMAIRIVHDLARLRPKAEFLVAGPKPDDVRHLFRDFRGIFRLLGPVETTGFYKGIDLLLHPAAQEPYGMVVAEAMAAKVGVVVSDRCGVADAVTCRHGSVLSLGDPVEKWVSSCRQLLDRSDPCPGYDRTWNQVALDYERLYRSLMESPQVRAGENRH